MKKQSIIGILTGKNNIIKAQIIDNFGQLRIKNKNPFYGGRINLPLSPSLQTTLRRNRQPHLVEASQLPKALGSFLALWKPLFSPSFYLLLFLDCQSI